ncbi:MAG: hypothetical protein HETSPECPRED_003845 [Heterodermia speciosa]|uniref:Uncharacterized protein n=1 Tax=Heterodermia speciosa TaxID=116794 RepID=A0A8H3J731_9LECA|nr:MAG: hypothetical protein HETSPECPRED_003845 [Heterodermia speciosa]
MATKYDDFPSETSEFSFMRDSLFILCVMNQYSVKPELPPIEAERLLRLALFSNMLQLPHAEDGEKDLLRRRTKLARDLREGRKKGVVPVFVSFLWFVFALALSIQLAFGSLGNNQTAHNLAIGFLSGWLPIMVLASTVDRNAVSADSIQAKLNTLLSDVRLALLDEVTMTAYMQVTKTGQEDFTWCNGLLDADVFDGNFFTDFSGQGRRHWHYGVAHPLLAGIESKFMAEYGRDWLNDGYAARLAIVVGSRNINGLKMFDPRMMWQILSSIFIVGGSAGGAFVISYYTPTVGLGCRTGGYLVYMNIAFGLLIVELIVWYLTHETATRSSVSMRTRLQITLAHFRSQKRPDVSIGKRLASSIRAWASRLSSRDVIRKFVLRPCEAFNSAWLAYIISAQTFGSYQTCACMATTWAGHGGYIDFETYADYGAKGVNYFWGAATALSITVMTAGLAYIAVEFCTQSHLSTEDYGRAMQGLKQTRRFKRYTLVFRAIPDLVIKAAKLLSSKSSRGRTRPGRRGLVWTMKTREHTDFFQISEDKVER